MTKDLFLSFDLEAQVNIWNKFSSENNWNEYFYENDEMTISGLYNRNIYKLAHDIHYGEYDYNDTYFYYDDLGLLVSFSDVEFFHDVIDIDEMITWYNNTYKGE
jgi:hypothetical protein